MLVYFAIRWIQQNRLFRTLAYILEPFISGPPVRYIL